MTPTIITCLCGKMYHHMDDVYCVCVASIFWIVLHLDLRFQSQFTSSQDWPYSFCKSITTWQSHTSTLYPRNICNATSQSIYIYLEFVMNFPIVISRGNSYNSYPITLDQNPPLLWKWYTTSSTIPTILWYLRTPSRGEETQKCPFSGFPITKYLSICIFPMVFGCLSLYRKCQHPPHSPAQSTCKKVKRIG